MPRHFERTRHSIRTRHRSTNWLVTQRTSGARCRSTRPPGIATIATNGSICILATRVEPQLGRDRPEIIYHYPASQASLAKTTTSPAGYEVAERFELYYRGIELANGYHELADAAEQRRRFEAVNAARVADGRPALPLPESLLAALEHGLPDCTGRRVGL